MEVVEDVTRFVGCAESSLIMIGDSWTINKRSEPTRTMYDYRFGSATKSYSGQWGFSPNSPWIGGWPIASKRKLSIHSHFFFTTTMYTFICFILLCALRL